MWLKIFIRKELDYGKFIVPIVFSVQVSHYYKNYEI